MCITMLICRPAPYSLVCGQSFYVQDNALLIESRSTVLHSTFCLFAWLLHSCSFATTLPRVTEKRWSFSPLLFSCSISCGCMFKFPTIQSHSPALCAQIVQTSLDILVVVVDLFLREGALCPQAAQRLPQSHHFLFAPLSVEALIADVLLKKQVSSLSFHCLCHSFLESWQYSTCTMELITDW